MRRLAASCCLLGLAGPLACAEPLPSHERIVLVVIDTLRRDHAGPDQENAATPHLDRLATRGRVFPRALSSFHQTTMSMASLFTGRTPSLETGNPERALPWNGRHWCGMRRFASGTDDACIPDALSTLAEQIREAGYWTAGVVTNPLIFNPLGYDQGFDFWAEIGGTARDRRAHSANMGVRKALLDRESDRFFLYVHYMDAHDYYRHESYAAAVAEADAGLGALLEMLEKEGLLEGSVLVVAADHGERLGEEHLLPGSKAHYGNPSFEELLRVPLIVTPPVADGLDPGSPLRSDDVHRLVLRLAGIRAEPSPDLEPGELYLSEHGYQTYRRGRWKSFGRRDGTGFWLVDLEADPQERRDVAEQHPEVAAAHRERTRRLAVTLGAAEAAPAELTDDDELRLRALGYLEDLPEERRSPR